MIRYFLIALVHYPVLVCLETKGRHGHWLPTLAELDERFEIDTLRAVVWPLTDFFILAGALTRLYRGRS